MPSCTCRFAALLALSMCWAGTTCRAQEIEPRAYSPSPSGVNFLVLVAGHSEGGVLTDPSVPVTDIEAKIGAWDLATAEPLACSATRRTSP